jgi:hypothetical protein
MAALLRRKIEADQFDKMLVQRASNPMNMFSTYFLGYAISIV